MTHLPDEVGADDWEIPDFGLDGPDSADAGDDSLDFLPGPIPEPDDESAPVPVVEPSAPLPLVPNGPTMPVFTVSNPSGTVTATALIVGKLHRIDLSAGSKSAPSMSEAELAQEILLVGGLAAQKARSELFTYLVNGTAAAGRDPIATGRFLREDIGLPTPEQSVAARAEAFGARYLESHD